MKKITSVLLASTLMLLANNDIHKEGHAEWGYTGHNTPDKWGTLSENFRECGAGLNQSPINITHSLHANLPPLNPSYTTNSVDVLDNGHTIQINMAPGSTFSIEGQTFELKQFHFHAPSENHIEGKSFALEGHFVNVDKNGHIAVIALMFEEGKSNATLEKIWSNMPSHAGEDKKLELVKIAQELLPEDKHYYRFNGSLTTPPCTEGVKWFVLKTPVTISKEQVERFHEIMPSNNRPIQPLDARVLVD
jgi:carbonic anhydrase